MSVKYYVTSIIILVISLLVHTCKFSTSGNDDQNGREEVVDVSHFSIEIYPKVDGSTSTHPLQVIIACEILGVEYNWFDWWDGTMRVWPSDDDPSKQDIVEYIRQIQHRGTHGSYVNLITDSVDIIIVAREPSQDELYLADSLGVSLNTKAIALDAFVFILNIENPVIDLSVDQIIGIYTGNITNWRDVGGINAAINPYQRNKNSGSQELMEALVMQGIPMVDAPQMIEFGMMGPINRLVSDPYGIGYTVYFFNQFMAPRERIKVCAVNGIKPDPLTISSGTYIYTTKVYAAIRSNLDSDSTAFTFWRWLHTQAGQKIVGLSGYVPFVEK
jgi:phosphate transport system substrate-binding protein